MWWKIYFWVMAFFGAVGVLGFSFILPWNLMEWFEIGISVIILVGLYAYVYKKSIWNRRVWHITFWAYIAWCVYSLVYFYTPLYGHVPAYFVSRINIHGWYIVLGIFLSLPEFYALYQLSLAKKVSAKKKKK